MQRVATTTHRARGTDDDRHKMALRCICDLDECVCGLAVPEYDPDNKGACGDASTSAPRSAAAARQSRKKQRGQGSGASSADSFAAAADPALFEDAAPFDPSIAIGVDDGGKPPAPAPAAARHAVRFASLGLGMKPPDPPDREAQLQAAVVDEYVRLRCADKPLPRGGRGRGRGCGRGRDGGGDSRGRAPEPAAADGPARPSVQGSIEAMQEDECEWMSAYCEVELTGELISACGQGDDQAVEELLREFELDASASVRADGVTPLIAAARAGHVRLIALLLSHGAEAEAADAEGRSAFWWACAQGHAHAAALLLDHGAGPIGAPLDGPSALAAAVSCGHEGVVALLLERAKPASAHEAEARPGSAAGGPSGQRDEGVPGPSGSDGAAARGEAGLGTPADESLRAMVDADLARHAEELGERDIARALWRYLRGGGSESEATAAADSAADASRRSGGDGAAPQSTEPAGSGASAEAAPKLPVDLYNERGLDESGKPVWHKPPTWLAPHGDARRADASPPRCFPAVRTPRRADVRVLLLCTPYRATQVARKAL